MRTLGFAGIRETSVQATAGVKQSLGPSADGLYTCWPPAASSIEGMCQEELIWPSSLWATQTTFSSLLYACLSKSI